MLIDAQVSVAFASFCRAWVMEDRRSLLFLVRLVLVPLPLAKVATS